MTSKKNDETYIEYRDRVLEKLSPSFCGAKWYHATIWLGSALTASCHHTPAHKISLEEVQKDYKAIHNTPEKKEDRRLMQLGQRPSGCEYCWKIEDMGKDKVSDRFIKSSGCDLDSLNSAKNNSYNDNFNLDSLEIAFDRTCQFACSYCNSAYSSTWTKDIKNNGPYENILIYDKPQLYDYNESNPYVEAFFKWWEADLHKTLHELRITGGEPLMSGHTWKLLDWFKENKNKSNIAFAINSNLGFDKDVIDRLLISLEGIKFTLYSSNESFGSHAEYIRDGLKWNQWVTNMEYLLDSKRLEMLSVMTTINAICLDSLPEFLDLIMRWKRIYGKYQITISFNILRDPRYQSICVLPDNLKVLYKQKLEKWFKDNEDNHQYMCLEEVDHFKRLIDYIDTVETPSDNKIFNRAEEEKRFKMFYQQYDKRRNKDFTKTFSKEMVEWYDSI